MSRARELSRLGNPNIISTDGDYNIGFGTLTPRAKGDFVGVVSATSFYGDGSTLTGVAAAGIGTALSDDKTSPLNSLFYTNQTYTIGVSTTIDPPTSGSLGYSQASEIEVGDGADLTVADGDIFMVDVLGITTDPLVGASVDNNYLFSNIYADNITNQAGTGAPDASQGFKISKTTESTNSITGALIVSGGVGIAKSLHVGGNVSVAGTLTYEDVTNVDVLGIATYRSGVKFGVAGVGGTITAAGNAEFTGVCTATSFVGDGSSLTGIDAAPSISGIASGSIASGASVVILGDGKLGSVSGSIESKGSQGTLVSATNEFFAGCYDTTNNKVVVFYRDGSDNKGRGAVGTVSGSSISWGTPVEFEAGLTSWLSACYDTTNNKVICAYCDGGDSNKGKVVVGEVSGTSITFGTPVIFNATATEEIDCVYCSQPDKIAITYIDDGHSDDRGEAIIGEVSGTNSITLGTEVRFSASGAKVIRSGCCWDSTEEKLLITWGDYANSERGTIVAGSLSGNSVSFGSLVVFDTDRSDSQNKIAHDSATGKNLIVWTEGSGGSGYYCKSRVANVSGTTITLGADTYTVNAANSKRANVGYDSIAKKFLIVYYDTPATSGYSVIATVTGDVITLGDKYQFQTTDGMHDSEPMIVYDSDTYGNIVMTRSGAGAKYYIENIRSSNATSSNFLGFSQAAYTNGQTAKVSVVGSTITNQTGLTTASQYYVLGNGSLGTTADSASIEAGKSLSFTNLLVKG